MQVTGIIHITHFADDVKISRRSHPGPLRRTWLANSFDTHRRVLHCARSARPDKRVRMEGPWNIPRAPGRGSFQSSGCGPGRKRGPRNGLCPSPRRQVLRARLANSVALHTECSATHRDLQLAGRLRTLSGAFAAASRAVGCGAPFLLLFVSRLAAARKDRLKGVDDRRKHYFLGAILRTDTKDPILGTCLPNMAPLHEEVGPRMPRPARLAHR